MKRYGQIIRMKPGYEQRYRELHRNPWEEINAVIKSCGIRNYSIFLRDGFLFAYFEYVGDNFEEDMAKMAADEATKRWWKETDICQEPIDTAVPGEWWTNMDEVYHLD